MKIKENNVIVHNTFTHFTERDCKRNLNWPSKQRWQWPLYNGKISLSELDKNFKILKMISFNCFIYCYQQACPKKIKKESTLNILWNSFRLLNIVTFALNVR